MIILGFRNLIVKHDLIIKETICRGPVKEQNRLLTLNAPMRSACNVLRKRMEDMVLRGNNLRMYTYILHTFDSLTFATF